MLDRTGLEDPVLGIEINRNLLAPPVHGGGGITIT
jgi:hypothetical protein